MAGALENLNAGNLTVNLAGRLAERRTGRLNIVDGNKTEPILNLDKNFTKREHNEPFEDKNFTVNNELLENSHYGAVDKNGKKRGEGRHNFKGALLDYSLERPPTNSTQVFTNIFLRKNSFELFHRPIESQSSSSSLDGCPSKHDVRVSTRHGVTDWPTGECWKFGKGGWGCVHPSHLHSSFTALNNNNYTFAVDSCII